MGYIQDFICDKCGTSFTSDSDPVVLRVLDVSLLPVLDYFEKPGVVIAETKEEWCNECGRRVPVESLTPVARVRERLAALEASGPSTDLDSPRVASKAKALGVAEVEAAMRLYRDDVRLLREQIEWRRNRRSSRRCIRCGSTDVNDIKELEDERGPPQFMFLHPGCGGTFRSKDLGGHRRTFGGPVIDAEGNKVGKHDVRV